MNGLTVTSVPINIPKNAKLHINTVDINVDLPSVTLGPVSCLASSVSSSSTSTSSSTGTQPPSPIPSPLSRSLGVLINPFPINDELRNCVAPFNFTKRANMVARLSSMVVNHKATLVKEKSTPSYFGTHHSRHVSLKDNLIYIGPTESKTTTIVDLAECVAHRGRKRDPNADDDWPAPISTVDFTSHVLTLTCKSAYKVSGNTQKKVFDQVIKLTTPSAADAEAWITEIEKSQALYITYPMKPLTAKCPSFMVIGCSNSGRSTVFKQALCWRPIGYKGLTPEAVLDADFRRPYRIRLLAHLLRGLSTLCALTDSNPEYHDILNHDVVVAGEICSDEVRKLREIEMEELGDDRYVLKAKLLQTIELIIHNDLIQKTLEVHSTSSADLRTLSHLISLIPKLKEHSFVPSYRDILNTHFTSNTVGWKTIPLMNDEKFRCYDMGGSSQNDRENKWKLERFNHANVLIFTVDLAGFDQPSETLKRVSNGATKLYESIILYEQLLASPYLKGPIHVVFTGLDVLKLKLQQMQFSKSIPLYAGLNDVNCVVDYISTLFSDIGGKRFYGYAVNSLDSEHMKNVINTITKISLAL